MKSVSVNMTGRSHSYYEKPCEDAVYVNDDQSVFVVCDGVSSSAYGGLGAKAMANGIGSFLVNNKEELFLEKRRNIKRLVCREIESIYDTLCREYQSTDKAAFSSTLLFAAICGNEMLVGHIGDGAIFSLSDCPQPASSILSYPDNADDGAVYAASSTAGQQRMRLLRLNTENYFAIGLATDGFSDAYINEEGDTYYAKNLARDIARVVHSPFVPGALDELIRNRVILEKNISDDISVVLLYCEKSDAAIVDYADDMAVWENIRPVDAAQTPSEGDDKRAKQKKRKQDRKRRKKEKKQTEKADKGAAQKDPPFLPPRRWIILLVVFLVFLFASLFAALIDCNNRITDLVENDVSMSKSLEQLQNAILPLPSVIQEPTLEGETDEIRAEQAP